MNPSRVRWGITLILVGLVLLANNLGQVTWWVWYDLLRLWPVLLIIIGLEVIVKRTKLQWLGYLSSLIVIGTFAYVIADNRGYVDDDAFGAYPSSRGESVQEYENQTSASVKVKFSDGRLYFNSGDSDLLRAVAENSRAGINLKSTTSGGNCDMELTPTTKHWPRWLKVGSYENHWKCYVRPEISGSYDLSLDNADLRFFAQDLRVDNLKIDGDRSDLVVRLGKDQAHSALDVSGDHTDLDLYLPDSVGLRVEGTYPPESDQHAMGLSDRGGYLANDLFQTASASFSLKANLDHGKVRISTY